MLQTSRSNSDSPIANESEPAAILELALDFLRRQYLIIACTTILAAAAGLGYLLITPPTYTAYAKVIADVRKGQFFQQQSLIADAPINSAQLESQLQILKSENVAKAVIDKLDLTRDPEFVGPGHGFWAAINPFQSSDEKSKALLMREVIDAFENRLDAKLAGLSYIIEVGFQARDPEKAAQIANAIADSYIVELQQGQINANERVTDWLQNRLGGVQEQVANADHAVVAFKKDNNIVSANGKLMGEQQLSDLSSELGTAHNRTSEALAKIYRIEAVIRKDAASKTLDATVSDALSDPVITKLREQYLDVATRESNWAARYGANHEAVVKLRNQLKDIRTSISSQLKQLAETYRSDYEISKQRENEIESRLAAVVSQSQTTNTAQVKLRELESSAQNYRHLYEDFLRHYTESVEQQSLPITQARIIARASAPLHKSQPKSLLVLAVSLMGGIGLGAGIGLLRELMDRVFRTGDQVEALLQTPCAALVPLLNGHTSGKDLLPAKSAQISLKPRTIATNSSAYWTLVNSPMSHFAEAVRSIKVAADAVELNGRSNKVIGLTSALPNEGKSTIVAALAQLIAQVGYKIILVDCDLRNPSLSRAFSQEAEAGIADVIFGKKPLNEVIWREPSTNLAFLPVGKHAGLSHTSEILASDATKNLFDSLRQSYDYVIVDLPPLAPLVDVRATTRFIDSYFLVIEWGHTKVDVVQHALNTARGVHDNLVGAILNKTDLNSLRRYEHHRQKYYFNEHFSRYGYTDTA